MFRCNSKQQQKTYYWCCGSFLSTAKGEANGAAAGGGGDDLAGRPLCKQVSELLGRVVSSSATRGNPRLWEVYARFNQGAGR